MVTPDTMTLLLSGLQAAGFSVNQDTRPAPASHASSLARMAVVHIMVQACKRVDLRWGDVATTGAVPGCEPFQTAHDVHGVSGHSLSTDGGAVYEAVYAACASGGAVTLEGPDRRVVAKVPCQHPRGRRPLRYRVTGG